MKIFVTGGGGFIGSHLVDYLLEKGHTITVYDNLSSGKLEFIGDQVKNGTVRFIKADLLDLPKLKKSISGHDFVFHLAANPDIRYGIVKTETDLKQGTVVTYNVLEAMRTAGINKVAFSSSSVVYGETKISPIPENHAPLHPISLYGASKLASEGLMTAFSGTFGFQVWIFRFANIVGPRATHGIIYDFLGKIGKNKKSLEVLGNGKQEKSYLHTTECVDAIYYIITHSKERINVFNLGAGDCLRVSDIAKIFLKETGNIKTKISYTGGDRGWKGDVPRFILDVLKINKLGWKAKLSSEEAVKRAIKEIQCKH